MMRYKVGDRFKNKFGDIFIITTIARDADAYLLEVEHSSKRHMQDMVMDDYSISLCLRDGVWTEMLNPKQALITRLKRC